MKLRIIDTGYHATPNPQNSNVHRWITRQDNYYTGWHDKVGQWSFDLRAGGLSLSPAELLRMEIDFDRGTFRVNYNGYFDAVPTQHLPRDNRWHTYPIWMHDQRQTVLPVYLTPMRMIGRIRMQILEPIYDHWMDAIQARIAILESTAINDPTATVRDCIDDVLAIRREILLARLGQQ